MYFDYSRLIGLMAQKGITRRDMASKVGQSRTWFSTVLKNGLPMSNDLIFRVAQVLETDDYSNLFFTLNVEKH